MMFTHFAAAKLCSNNSQNPHRHGTGQGDESCWAHIANEYGDNSSTARWIIQTPDSSRGIVGPLSELPRGWQPEINVQNRDRLNIQLTGANLCRSLTFRFTDSTGTPVDGVEVWLLTSYGQNILQGTTGSYDTGGPIVNFGAGVIPITGAHIGDRIMARGTYYVIRQSDCARLTSRREGLFGGVQFLKVAAHAQTRSESSVITVRLPAETASIYASIEPVDNAGTLIARVRSDARFRSSPKAQVTLVGGTNVLGLDMRFDPATQMYSSDTFKLPIGTYANLQLTASDERGQETIRIFNFVVSPVNGDKSSEIFSADGQFGLSVAAGGLPQNAAVIVGPSSVAPPALETGYRVVSGPFRVSSSNATRIGEGSLVRFQLPNLKGGKTNDGVDPRTFQVLQHNRDSQGWETLGGAFLPAVEIISVPTNLLGDYVLVGRLPNAVALSQPTRPDEPVKPQEQMKSIPVVKEEQVATVPVTKEEQLKIKAELEVERSPLAGPCPLLVNFYGYITTSGPGQVKFIFTRNDGASSQVQALDFKEAGTQKVSTNWTIGDFKLLPHFEGWQAIKILSPIEFESAHANFMIDCKQ